MGRRGRYGGRGRYESYWPQYVPVAERRAQAQSKMEKLRKKGENIDPVVIEGRAIARSFWGKGWCKHLESFSDYSNRLPRGRTYARNGSVCHLEVKPGRLEALVSGSSLYKIAIDIKKLKPAIWKTVKGKCAGQIGSMIELLQGRLSDQVMTIVTDRENGLFPQPDEISLSCSCPDWAIMCKHVAAALYGVGARLDERPELLFILRDVDAEELISADIALPDADAGDDALADDTLGDIFGIDLDAGEDEAVSPIPAKARSATTRKKSKAKKPRAKKLETGKPKAKKPRARKSKPDKTAGPATSATRAKAKAEAIPTFTRAAAVGKKKRAQTTDAAAPATPPRPCPTGASILRLRESFGMSVVQMAIRLGVTPATIYRWERAPGPLNLRTRPLRALNALIQESSES
jgi:uncharacterized Zn finger protein